MQLTTTNNKGFAPATLTEAIQFSEMLANSSMVPKAYQGKPQDILVCVQWGYEMGLAPMQALQNIAVINGKPSVYGDAALALVQASSVCEDVQETMEDEGTPNPVAVCVAKRKNRSPVTVRFSVEDAKRAGLWGKQGPWQAYPKRMMQMRARGFALRDAFPDVLKGLITAEEAQDYPDEAKPAVDITPPRNPLDRITSSPSEPVGNHIQIEAAMADTVEPEVIQEQAPEQVESVGFDVLVPGKEQPFSTHATLDDWQDAYENLAEKTYTAGKRSAQDRIAALTQLREANKQTLLKIDLTKRIRHLAAYQKRTESLAVS
jgi:hypothetical protein